MKDHRVRLKDGDLELIEEALDVYISKRLEGLTEEETENLNDPKVKRAVELWDRFQMLRAGRPRKAGTIIKEKNKPISQKEP